MAVDYKKMGITDHEWKSIVDFLGREPNLTETGIISVMWSEHCSYKNSKKHLRRFPTEGSQILQGPGENAGVVDIGDGWAVTFKVESHNHPSAVEPYQGAATGVGGILRDIFTMGARPVAVLDSLRFGSLNIPKNRHIFEGVIDGIAGYGNCIGVPTVGGEIYVDEAYNENPLVNVLAAGIMRHEDLRKGTAKGENYPVYIVGSATGRDGIHGATFASDELSDDSIEDRASVQVGDPFGEKLLLEACLELYKYDYIVGIQDMGAAGITCSTFEMSLRGDSGMDVELDLVPQREPNMTPYEIMLSESQERMLMVVKPGFEEKVEEIFNKWDVSIAKIGKVTNDKKVTIRKSGKIEAELPVEFVVEGFPVYDREEKEPEYFKNINMTQKEFEILPEENFENVFKKMLESKNLCSRKGVFEQYDHQVQLNTLKKPATSDAAVLRVKETEKAFGLTADCNSRYCYIDPYNGARLSMLESARNLVAAGLKPVAITDGLNFGNPLDPEVYYQFVKCIDGIIEICKELQTPVTGGNVSFYNQSGKKAIYPTPIIGMLGLTDNYKNIKGIAFKKGEEIGLIEDFSDEIGGSEYLKEIHGLVKGPLPKVDVKKDKKTMNFILENLKMFSSIHDVSEGGIAL
ncbi:MAG: phosphoribosylformylglycinamidine synthase subunit PurL, partial [Candidatus Muiribacteriota bacterium]